MKKNGVHRNKIKLNTFVRIIVYLLRRLWVAGSALALGGWSYLIIYIGGWKAYAPPSRQVAGGGCSLFRNSGGLVPG